MYITLSYLEEEWNINVIHKLGKTERMMSIRGIKEQTECTRKKAGRISSKGPTFVNLLLQSIRK